MATHITGEDCQGNPQSYWRATRYNSEGTLFTATGGSNEEAERNADEKLEEKNAFLKQSIFTQLNEISQKKNLFDSDIQRAIKHINTILQKARGKIDPNKEL